MSLGDVSFKIEWGGEKNCGQEIGTNEKVGCNLRSVGIAGRLAFKQGLKEVRELATDRREDHSRQRVQPVMHRYSECSRNNQKASTSGLQ